MSDPTIPNTEALQKCLREFYAFASAHDAEITARTLAADDVSATVDAVAVLRMWLQRYSDALHRRR